MEAKQLVVFLCKCEEWDKYVTSNPGFTPKESWLIHEDTGKERVFGVTSWTEADRKNTSELLDEGEEPDETLFPWCGELQRQEIPTSLKIGEGTEVIVFIHWGDTSTREKMKSPSVKLQDHLNKMPECGNWKIYSLSSHNMDVTVGPIGRVFDVGEPVVPVSNFDDWFKMYTKWWEDGRSAVETAYSPPVAFPNHKDGRIILTDTGGANSREDGNGNTSSGGKGSAETTPQGISPKCKNVLSLVVALPLGIMIGALSLVPVWMTYRCLDAISFQAKTVRGTVSILLMALFSTVFTELIFGWLLLTILPRRNGGTND